MVRFGEQKLVGPDVGKLERALFRLMGVTAPAHFLHSYYLRHELARLGHFNPARILDAGCGAGDHSFYLARAYGDAEVLGVDINEARLQRNTTTAQALGLTNVRFERVDLSTARLEPAFDLIVCIDVLEHIPHQQEALENLSRALRPGGIAFYHIPTVRQRPVPFSRWLKGFHEWTADKHRAEERTAEELVVAVRDSGLDVLRAIRTFGFYTGELANSLYVLPYQRTTINLILLACFSPLCRVLALADRFNIERTRYALAVVSRKGSTAATSHARSR